MLVGHWGCLVVLIAGLLVATAAIEMSECSKGSELLQAAAARLAWPAIMQSSS